MKRSIIDTARASALWMEGQSARQIAEVFGVTRNAVMGLASRRRDLFPLRISDVARPSFTSDQIEEAVRLWKRNEPASRIVAAIGLATPTLFDSMRNRFRDRFPDRRAVTATAAAQSAKSVKAAATAAAAARRPDDAPPKEASEAPARTQAFRPLPGIAPMAVADALGGLCCKWPVHAEGDPIKERTRFFCGAPRCFDQPYCPEHRAMAFGTGTTSERKAVADAIRERRWSHARAA